MNGLAFDLHQTVRGLRFRQASPAFAGVAGYFRWSSHTLIEGGEPELLNGSLVSAEFFSVLGVPPLLGRTFAAGEDLPGAERVAVVSYGLWQRRFGGDPGLMNRTIDLDGRPTTVIGVMPRGFSFRAGDRSCCWARSRSRRSRSPRGAPRRSIPWWRFATNSDPERSLCPACFRRAGSACRSHQREDSNFPLAELCYRRGSLSPASTVSRESDHGGRTDYLIVSERRRALVGSLPLSLGS